MAPTTDQIFDKNNQSRDKNIYFNDIGPILECIDGCEVCQEYYIFYKLEAYAICECPCHENPLTSQDIEPIIFSAQRHFEEYKKEQNDLVRFSKSSIFDTIDEIFSRKSVRRCQN